MYFYIVSRSATKQLAITVHLYYHKHYMPPNSNQYFQPSTGPQQPVQPAPQMPANFAGLPKSGPPMGWVIAVILLVILLLGAVGFGYWAFSERQKYKNDTDAIVAAAQKETEKQTTEKNNLEFAEELKNPVNTYFGSSSYGSLEVPYPKTWSVFASNDGTGTQGGDPVDVYFHPEVVPPVSTTSEEAREALALRVRVVNKSYDKLVAERDKDVESGKLTADVFTLESMPDEIGIIFSGELSKERTGTEIILPLRDKSIIITTETDDYLDDINTYILPEFRFSP